MGKLTNTNSYQANEFCTRYYEFRSRQIYTKLTA